MKKCRMKEKKSIAVQRFASISCCYMLSHEDSQKKVNNNNKKDNKDKMLLKVKFILLMS